MNKKLPVMPAAAWEVEAARVAKLSVRADVPLAELQENAISPSLIAPSRSGPGLADGQDHELGLGAFLVCFGATSHVYNG